MKLYKSCFLDLLGLAAMLVGLGLIIVVPAKHWGASLLSALFVFGGIAIIELGRRVLIRNIAEEDRG